MAEYIDREQVCENCNNQNYCEKEKCPVYKVSTADVVPKSEVEKLQKQLAEMLVSEQTELHIPMEYLVRVRTEHPIYTAIKTEVAREIFREIEKLTPKKFTEKSQDFEFGYALAIQQIKNEFSELKKKYTEESK